MLPAGAIAWCWCWCWCACRPSCGGVASTSSNSKPWAGAQWACRRSNSAAPAGWPSACAGALSAPSPGPCWWRRWNTLYGGFVVPVVLFCIRFAEWRWRRFERLLLFIAAVAPGVLYAVLLLAPGSAPDDVFRLGLIVLVTLAVPTRPRRVFWPPPATTCVSRRMRLVSIWRPCAPASCSWRRPRSQSA